MKLFYLQGSCALAPHIALEHAGLVYEAVRVDRGKQAEASYLRINPLGRVPALATASHGTITVAGTEINAPELANVTLPPFPAEDTYTTPAAVT